MTRPASELLSFFFNDTATTEIYTLSLHDALPIGRTRDLGDGDAIEPARDEQLTRRVGDQLPCALLLALAQSGLFGDIHNGHNSATRILVLPYIYGCLT